MIGIHGRVARSVAAALAALLIVGAGLASADTSIREGEMTGDHYIREAPREPGRGGAQCQYGTAAHRLARVIAYAPRVFALDAHPGNGNDEQTVGWSARFQYHDGTAWRTLATSPISRATAKDNATAVFPAATRSYRLTEPGMRIRVLISFYWYNVDERNLVDGVSLHRVDWYYHRLEGEPLGNATMKNCRPIL